MERPARDGLEDRRELARGPGRFDPAVGGMLGQVQHLRAVDERRGASLGEIQPPRIHFRKVSHQLRNRVPLVRGQSFHGRQQLGIRQNRCCVERVDVHAPFYPRLFSTLTNSRGDRMTTIEGHGEERVISCAREPRGRA
jgi:hypothetical protein